MKRVPNSVNNLLPRNSSSKETFDNTKEDYQKALGKSGYKTKLFTKKTTTKATLKKITAKATQVANKGNIR